MVKESIQQHSISTVKVKELIMIKSLMRPLRVLIKQATMSY